MSETYRTFIAEDRPGVLRFGGARMALVDVEAGFWALRRQMEGMVGRRLTNSVLQQAGANGGASFARAFADGAAGAEAARAFADCVAAYQAAGFGHFDIVDSVWPIGHVSLRAQDAFEAWTARQRGETSGEPLCAYTAGVLVGFVNVIAGRQDIVCVEHACQAQGADACRFELLPARAAGDATVVALDPDPALSRQLDLLDLLFDRMPMGIAIFDRNYHIRRYNPTWAEFAERYAPPSAVDIAPGAYYFDLLPGAEPIVLPLFERVLAGETIRQGAVRIESEGIVTYWDVVLAPITDNGSVSGILNVTIDATERVEAQQNLEQRVAERTHELATLLHVSQTVNSTLELQPLLDLVLDQVKTVVDYTGTSILTLEDETLVVRAYRGPIPQQDVLQLRFALESAPANHEVIRRRAPVIIPNVRSDSSLARLFQNGAGEELDTTFGYVRSWLGVPLIAKDRIIGMLTLDHNQPDFFNDQHANLILTFANQVAAAIENARLYQAELEQLEDSERRRRVAEGLRDILDVLNSNRSLAEVLDFIVVQARDLLAADATIFQRIDFEREKTTAEASSNLPADFDAARVTRLHYTPEERTLMARQPIIQPDFQAQNDAGDGLDEAMKAWRAAERKHYRSLLTVPVFTEEEVYGSLRFYFSEPRDFDEEDVHLAMMLGDHAALAIENAWLRTKAEEAAVATERNRLARDLHDAVTQTLFSASLIAEVLPRLWERKPEEGERRLAELRELTRGALAEMRTLLLELRPSALVEAKLADLLRQLAESITGRARVPVDLVVEGECELNAEVKVALYRIAQEALNNVAKHSGASAAVVRLRCTAEEIELCIRDDGLGFETTSIPPNSLGVGIMRERAETIGAELKIESQPGHGTEVVVRWTDGPAG